MFPIEMVQLKATSILTNSYITQEIEVQLPESLCEDKLLLRCKQAFQDANLFKQDILETDPVAVLPDERSAEQLKN